MDIDQQDLEVFTTSHWHSACWQKIAIHFLDRTFQIWSISIRNKTEIIWLANFHKLFMWHIFIGHRFKFLIIFIFFYFLKFSLRLAMWCDGSFSLGSSSLKCWGKRCHLEIKLLTLKSKIRLLKKIKVRIYTIFYTRWTCVTNFKIITWKRRRTLCFIQPKAKGY